MKPGLNKISFCMKWLHNSGFAQAARLRWKSLSLTLLIFPFLTPHSEAQLQAHNANNTAAVANASFYDGASYSARQPTQDPVSYRTTSQPAYSPGNASYSQPAKREYYDQAAGAGAHPNSAAGASNISTGPGARSLSSHEWQFPYYSCAISRENSEHHYRGRARINHLRLPLYSCLPVLLNYPFSFEDFDSFTGSDDVVQLHSFDGYIVYGKDSLSGIVTFNKDEVYLDNTVNNMRRFHSYLLSTKNLKAVTVFSGSRELALVRLSGKDKKLSRVLHTGKLSIYDDKLLFPAANNVNGRALRVEYSGQIITLRGSREVKNQLVDYINRAYNTKLDAKNFSWEGLMYYIDRLD